MFKHYLFIRIICIMDEKLFGGIVMEAADIFRKIREREPGILHSDKLRKAAVLLPLVEVDGQTHILFEVRSSKMRSQPGDICFPGGRMEQADKNESETAIRETSEELGIPQSQITDVMPLDYIVSDMAGMIYPYIGKLTSVNDLNINELEVAEVFTVPLDYFIHTEPKRYKINFDVVPEKDFPFELIQNGEDYNWRKRQMDELFYVYHPSRVIWGLTAKIIHHFVEVLKN